MRGCNILNFDQFSTIFNVSVEPIGGVQVLFVHQKQLSPPLGWGLPWALFAHRPFFPTVEGSAEIMELQQIIQTCVDRNVEKSLTFVHAAALLGEKVFGLNIQKYCTETIAAQGLTMLQ